MAYQQKAHGAAASGNSSGWQRINRVMAHRLAQWR